MRSSTIDQVTIALKRAEADSLELVARRLRQEASELESSLLSQRFVQVIGRANRAG